ncbi:MAG: alpha,6-mannosyltransferase, partial [Actinomycetota bacterium]|nr:alpha,6-mannosyltransferase [Actinomycetota bacterium]
GLAILLAAEALRRRRPAVAGVLLAAAVLVKAVAVLPAIAGVIWVWRHEGRRYAATLVAGLVAPVALGFAVFGGVDAVAPVLAAGARRSRVSVWNLLGSGHALVPGLVTRHPVSMAVVVIGFTAVVVATRIADESPVPAFAASLVGYLLLAGYILPWYFAWVLPVAALDDASPLGRVVGAQTVVVLVAYQYESVRHGDGLDRLLQVAVGGARLVALAGSLVLLAVAIAVTASRRAATRPG